MGGVDCVLATEAEEVVMACEKGDVHTYTYIHYRTSFFLAGTGRVGVRGEGLLEFNGPRISGGEKQIH